MTTNTTPNAYQSFLLSLYEKGKTDQSFAKAYNSIPDMFIEQARQGYDMAFLNASHVSNARYASGVDNDLFRVVIQDPRSEADGISCKIVLQGFHDSNMNMIASTRVKSRPDKAKGEGYVRNFSSQLIGLSQRSVDAGTLTQDEYNDLLEYTTWWEGVQREHGQNAPYYKDLGFSRIRRYLVAKNSAFFIGFQLEERANTSDRPTDMPITIGTHSIVWSNVFIDSRPGLPYQTVGNADSAGKTAPAPIVEGYHSITTIAVESQAPATSNTTGFALPPRPSK